MLGEWALKQFEIAWGRGVSERMDKSRVGTVCANALDCFQYQGLSQ